MILRGETEVRGGGGNPPFPRVLYETLGSEYQSTGTPTVHMNPVWLSNCNLSTRVHASSYNDNPQYSCKTKWMYMPYYLTPLVPMIIRKSFDAIHL